MDTEKFYYILGFSKCKKFIIHSRKLFFEYCGDKPVKKVKNKRVGMQRFVHPSIVSKKTSTNVPSTTWTQKVIEAGIPGIL